MIIYKILHIKFIFVNMVASLFIYALLLLKVIDFDFFIVNKFQIYIGFSIYFLQSPVKVLNFKYLNLILVKNIFQTYLISYLPILMLFIVMNFLNGERFVSIAIESVFVVLWIYVSSLLVCSNSNKYIYYLLSTVFYSVLSVLLWKLH